MRIRIGPLEQVLLNLAFFGLVLGWRGLELIPGMRIYPISFFIWAGFFVCLLKNNGILIKPRSNLSINVLFWLALLTLIGVANGLFQGHALGAVIQEALVFFDFFPLYFLVSYSIKSPEEILKKQNLLIFAGILISAFGIIEYIFPEVGTLFPSLFTNLEYYRVNVISGVSMRLSNFSIWGGSIVAVILVPLLGLLIPWLDFKLQAKSLLKLLGALLLLGGIVISGYRSAWLGLGALFLIMLFLGRKLERRLGAILFIVVVIFLLLPNQFIIRAESILSPEIMVDQTVITRTEKISEGLNSLVNNPLLGTGWASPAVFLDQLYVGVSIGLPGLLLFLVWYGAAVFRQWKYARIMVRTDNRKLAMGFVYALGSYFVCMVSGVMGQVPPLMSAFWLFFILGWRFLDISSKNLSTSQGN